MDLNELIISKNAKVAEMQRLVSVGEAEKRELTAEENTNFVAIQDEIRGLETQIAEKNNINNTINLKTDRKMTDFKELIVRNADGNISNFSARGVVIASGIDNVQVAGNISEVGYEPFYKSLPNLDIMPGLISSMKLPFLNGAQAQKKGEGLSWNNDKTLATILLQPSRYTITDVIGKEIQAVGSEQAFQAFIAKLMKACDKAITADIFNVAVAGASAQAGLTGYTNVTMDTLVGAVDGDATLLMPRPEFYRAKAVKLDNYSNLFLANKDSNYAGHLWDGTSLFYSQLFTGNTIVAVDLQHVTVGEFGSEYEITIDPYSQAPAGQIVVTVCKMAGVVLRNALAAKKAVIA